MAASMPAVTARDDVIDDELAALITKIGLAPPLDQFAVFSDCAFEAAVCVHNGRLDKLDMVDRFMQAARGIRPCCRLWR
jgi:hypothetical protein